MAYDKESYEAIRHDGAAWYERLKNGSIRVSGGEARRFLNGLVTNDLETLEDGRWMLAAFPNVQGRLLAVVKIHYSAGGYFVATDAETHHKVLENLMRFVPAGDFNVEDLSADRRTVAVRGKDALSVLGDLFRADADLFREQKVVRAEFKGVAAEIIETRRPKSFEVVLAAGNEAGFISALNDRGALAVEGETSEILRVERGAPRYGIDMDDETVVPEAGLADLISYEKGCYIGQEVIARIHFRGRPAKMLTGIVFERENVPLAAKDELFGEDGKSAGFITSTVDSPALGATVALAYVRNAYLNAGTGLVCGDAAGTVADLPLIDGGSQEPKRDA